MSHLTLGCTCYIFSKWWKYYIFWNYTQFRLVWISSVTVSRGCLHDDMTPGGYFSNNQHYNSIHVLKTRWVCIFLLVQNYIFYQNMHTFPKTLHFLPPGVHMYEPTPWGGGILWRSIKYALISVWLLLRLLKIIW